MIQLVPPLVPPSVVHRMSQRQFDHESSTAVSPQTSDWDSISRHLGEALTNDRTQEELRPLIRRWCEEARKRKLAPEQFLVVIKSQFAMIPRTRRTEREGFHRSAVLERVVTMCIEEYFRPFE